MIAEIALCHVEGCGGRIEFATDNIGRVHERCRRCEARNRQAAPPLITTTTETPMPETSRPVKTELACPKCSRPFTSKAWLDKHVATCNGKSAARPAAKTPPMPRPVTATTATAPAAAPVRASATRPVALTFEVIRVSARHVGIGEAHADQLIELLRFIGTLPLPAAH